MRGFRFGREDEIRGTWVKPFYMEMLHGNCLRLPEAEQARWVGQLLDASAKIDRAALEWLLSEDEWRGNMAGSWFAGISGRSDLSPLITDRFLASKLTYAGQGYCVYFALQGTTEAEAALCNYLDVYLDRPDLYYDQAWAMAALRSVSSRIGSDRAEYLDAGGKWDAWRKSAYPDRWESINEGPIDELLSLLGHQ